MIILLGFVAFLFSAAGMVTGLVIGQRTVPDLRSPDRNAELLAYRVVAIVVIVATITIFGVFGFWLFSREVINLEHPALRTCQDYTLPASSLAYAVKSEADPNQVSVPVTYTVCHSTQR